MDFLEKHEGVRYQIFWAFEFIYVGTNRSVGRPFIICRTSGLWQVEHGLDLMLVDERKETSFQVENFCFSFWSGPVRGVTMFIHKNLCRKNELMFEGNVRIQ